MKPETGTSTDLAEAAELVSKVSSAKTNGEALALILSYRKRVRSEALAATAPAPVAPTDEVLLRIAKNMPQIPWGIGSRSVDAIAFGRAVVAILASTKKDAPAVTDAQRLDWIARNLFERKWGGTLGRACDWYIRGDFRHTTQLMRGEDIRSAIDAAMSVTPPATDEGAS